MPYGLTSDGFVIKRLADIKADLETEFKAAFGSGINLQPQTPFGQIIGILAEREALVWELAEGVYNSFDPASSEGVPLQRLCSFVGVIKKEATKSTVTVTCIGTPATIIDAGTIFSVSGSPTSRFVTNAEATIAGGGTVDVECTAETAGEVVANAGSLTVIETPVAGLDSITNASDADVGLDEETDAELRARRDEELQQSNSGTLEAIRVALLDIENVKAAVGYENTTDTTDGDGRPPHSIEMVVYDGADADIAEAIWESKGGGIETYGTETENVVDSSGITRTINFSRPSEIDIYVEIDVERIEATGLPTEAQVKAKILEYGAGLNMGDDVLPVSGIIPKVAELSNIKDITIAVDTAGAPAVDDPITIAAKEIAIFDSGDITVNFS